MEESLGLGQVAHTQVHMPHARARYHAHPVLLAHSGFNERVQIQSLGGHDQLLPVHLPHLLRTICVHLDAEAVGVPQVDGFTHEMIGRTKLQMLASQVTHEPAERRATRKQDREVIQTKDTGPRHWPSVGVGPEFDQRRCLESGGQPGATGLFLA
jgi:hypothetical protein